MGLPEGVLKTLRTTRLVITITLVATASVACECVTIGDAQVNPQAEMTADLATAPAIFLGTVAAVEEISDPPGFLKGHTMTIQRRVTFIVDEAWKGVKRREFTVITGTGAGDCGYPFEVGLKYLVITTEAHVYPQKEPQVGICSNTMAADRALDYLVALHRLKRSRRFRASK